MMPAAPRDPTWRKSLRVRPLQVWVFAREVRFSIWLSFSGEAATWNFHRTTFAVHRWHLRESENCCRQSQVR